LDKSEKIKESKKCSNKAYCLEGLRFLASANGFVSFWDSVAFSRVAFSIVALTRVAFSRVSFVMVALVELFAAFSASRAKTWVARRARSIDTANIKFFILYLPLLFGLSGTDLNFVLHRVHSLGCISCSVFPGPVAEAGELAKSAYVLS